MADTYKLIVSSARPLVEHCKILQTLPTFDNNLTHFIPPTFTDFSAYGFVFSYQYVITQQILSMKIFFSLNLVLSCIFNSFYPALNIPNLSMLATTPKVRSQHPDNLNSSGVRCFLVKILVRLVKIFYS